MNYEEYLETLKKYKETDSIKEKEELEDLICTAAEGLLDTLVKLYAKYGKEFVEDSDYRDDRGYLSLESCGADYVDFHYSDRWSYGGECDFGIRVPMKYLDFDERNRLESTFKGKYAKDLVRKIDAKKKQIALLQKEIEDLEKELGKKGMEEQG